MTIRLVEEAINSPSGSIDDQRGPSYTRTFKVYCDSASDGALTVLHHLSVPQLGDSYQFGGPGGEFNVALPVLNKSANRESMGKHPQFGNVWVWEVRCDYAFKGGGGTSTTPPNEPENPLMRPVRYNGSIVTEMELIDKDKDGNVIINSAQEPFPPHERRRSLVAINFVRNEPDSPLAKARSFVNRVNSDYIWGGLARTWLCDSMEWQELWEGTFNYFEVTYKFIYDPKLHVL